MPKRANVPAVAAAAQKRQRLEVVAGDDVVVCHSAPRAKRLRQLFAGMRGTVVSTTGLTLDVRFQLPKASIALYSDFLGAAEASISEGRLRALHEAPRGGVGRKCGGALASRPRGAPGLLFEEKRHAPLFFSRVRLPARAAASGGRGGTGQGRATAPRMLE